MRDEFYLIKNENGIVTDVIHNGKGKKYTVKYDRTMDNAMFGYLLSYNTYYEDTVMSILNFCAGFVVSYFTDFSMMAMIIYVVCYLILSRFERV